MSGLAAILGTPGAIDTSALPPMLGRAGLRGGDRVQAWAGEGAVLGVCRADWEGTADFAADAMVHEHGPVVLVADASLYYRDDLVRALRGAGVQLRGTSPSELIAAAYLAWGPRLVEVIEGDYSFVLWDRHRQQLLAARDFAGTRPLYYAWVRDQLILSSCLTAVVAHPAVPAALNPLAIAEDIIGGSTREVGETVYRAVANLPAGSRLLWQPGQAPRVERFWEVPRFDQEGGSPEADAPEQLRALLRAAVRERMAGGGPTAVWTSGGYDSPSVFALAWDVAARSGRGPVTPVSMSYPEGDPGREDELVAALGAHACAPIHWVRIGDVPDLPDPMQWAQERDQPFAHPYEEWNCALARGARATGARVILGGNGGDQFFSVSPVFLADLARAGRIGELIAEARALGLRRRHWRQFFHWAIQPALPPALLDLARRMRGGRGLRPHLATAVPEWLGLPAEVREALVARQWDYVHRRPDETLGSAEASWYLTTGFGPRICAMVMGIVQQEGAEVRSPLYDRRVLEFVARRPRRERFSRGESKVLLRRALAGLLPEAHLAPRQNRTGLPRNYLQRVRRQAIARGAVLAGDRLWLSDLGLVRRESVEAALRQYQNTLTWEGTLGSELFCLFSTEFWLRSQTRRAAGDMALVA